MRHGGRKSRGKTGEAARKEGQIGRRVGEGQRRGRALGGRQSFTGKGCDTPGHGGLCMVMAAWSCEGSLVGSVQFLSAPVGVAKIGMSPQAGGEPL